MKSIPETHGDLLDCPPVAALTTVMPSGRPHTTPVWCSFDGAHVQINVMRGFQKEKNMRRNPRVTLLCYDPRAPRRWLEVRGRVVQMTEVSAMQHLDMLTLRYTGRTPFFGTSVPAEFRLTEIPVICTILPTFVAAHGR
jgi:PPOX class probable F420-dependent enzyme